MPLPVFTVLRHSGKANGRWRTVYSSISEVKAVRKYYRVRARMRQGECQLWEDSVLVRHDTAQEILTRKLPKW